MMFENKFDETIEDVSERNNCNWSDETKIVLFARFCKDQAVSLPAWKKFLESQAKSEQESWGGDKEPDYGG